MQGPPRDRGTGRLGAIISEAARTCIPPPPKKGALCEAICWTIGGNGEHASTAARSQSPRSQSAAELGSNRRAPTGMWRLSELLSPAGRGGNNHTGHIVRRVISNAKHSTDGRTASALAWGRQDACRLSRRPFSSLGLPGAIWPPGWPAHDHDWALLLTPALQLPTVLRHVL